MNSSASLLAEAFQSISEVDVLLGRFVSQDGALAVVDVGDARLAVPTLAHVQPVTGDAVRLLRVGKELVLLGGTVPRSPIGRVSATGSPRCTVEYPAGSGVTQLMAFPNNITPAVNDIVLIDWSSGGTIAARLSTNPTAPTPQPAPPPPSSSPITQVFTAVDSGTRSSSGWFNSSELWASNTTKSAWWYGSKIRDTIPTAATIVTAEIFLPIFQSFGDPPLLRVHTDASRPSGYPNFAGGSTALNPRQGWVAIPTSYLDELKTTVGGVGFDTGGFNKYRGVTTDAQSGALRVTYRS